MTWSQFVGTRGHVADVAEGMPQPEHPFVELLFFEEVAGQVQGRASCPHPGAVTFLLGEISLRVGPLTLGLLPSAGHGRIEPGVPEEQHRGDRDHGDHQQRCCTGYHPGLVSPGPPRQPLVPSLAIRRDRLVGQPVLEVLGQGARRGVPVLRLRRDRLAADRLQGTQAGDSREGCPERRDRAALGLRRDVCVARVGERRMAGQQGIKRRPQAVKVTGRADLVPPALRLFRTRVLGRAQRRAGLREGEIGFGQAPSRSCLNAVRGSSD